MEDKPIILVGTKADLLMDKNYLKELKLEYAKEEETFEVVKEKQARKVAKEIGAFAYGKKLFCWSEVTFPVKCSAKTGKNIQLVFDTVVLELVARRFPVLRAKKKGLFASSSVTSCVDDDVALFGTSAQAI